MFAYLPKPLTSGIKASRRRLQNSTSAFLHSLDPEPTSAYRKRDSSRQRKFDKKLG
jgi:hypothetical protein